LPRLTLIVASAMSGFSAVKKRRAHGGRDVRDILEAAGSDRNDLSG